MVVSGLVLYEEWNGTYFNFTLSKELVFAKRFMVVDPNEEFWRVITGGKDESFVPIAGHQVYSKHSEMHTTQEKKSCYDHA